MLTLLINESNPLDGLFANSTTGGVGTVPDITVADDGQAVSVQSFTRASGIITDSFVAGDVLHIGIGDGVNAPVCYVELSSASPAVGTMPINTAGMVALFAATVANQLSLTLAVVRTRGAYTNTIFSAPIVIRRSAINISTAVPTPSILGTGVAAALQVAINTALGFVRLDASARLPAVDGSQLTNVPNELPSQTGNSGKYLTTNGTATSWGTVSTGLTVGTTAIASGTTTRVLYDNAGVLGEYAISGTGSVAMTTSPSFTTPTIGDGTESAPSMSFTSDTNTGVYRPAADTVGIVGGGNDVVRLTGIASATDYIEIKNGIGVGSPLHVLAEGASANIGVHLQPKGSGLFTISDGTDFNKGIRFRSSSSAAGAITLLDAVSTAGRVVTLPDATGTLALVSGDLGTPSALVGTNITGTASGLTAGLVTSIGNLTGDMTSSNRATTLATVNSNVGSFTNASLTVNAKGLVTAASSGTAAVTSITGTANEITVTGTTTPTLSLPSALTFTGKTVTGGTFSAPTLFEPQAVVYKILNNQDGTRQGHLTNDFKHVFLDSGGDIFLRSTDFISSYLKLAHFEASTGQMSLGHSAFLSGKIGFKNSTSTGTTILASANTSATDYTATLPAATGTLLLANGSGANLTSLNASNVSSGTLAAARMANAGVHTGDATGTFPAITLNAAQTGITSVGTLTGGATGAGFTVALSTSTITGTLADARLSANVPLLNAANTFTGENINSKSGAASVTAMKFSGVPFAGTGTTSFPLVYINDANATASTTLNTAGTYFGVNGDGTQDLMNLMADGVSKVRVKSTGEITVGIPTGGSPTGMTMQGPLIAGSTSISGFLISGTVIQGHASSTIGFTQYGRGDVGINDVAFSRTTSTANSMSLGNGTAGNTSGSLLLANLTASGTLAVTGATTLTGNLTSNGAYISTPQALSGNGAVAAVNLTTEVTTIANTGTANTTTTLAAGTNGQKKVISFITDGGFDAVITVTNPAWGGAGTITMNDALDNIELRYLNSVWQVFINNGCTLA